LVAVNGWFRPQVGPATGGDGDGGGDGGGVEVVVGGAGDSTWSGGDEDGDGGCDDGGIEVGGGSGDKVSVHG